MTDESLQRLLALNLPPETLREVLSIIASDSRKATRAARNRRYYLAKKAKEGAASSPAEPPAPAASEFKTPPAVLPRLKSPKKGVLSRLNKTPETVLKPSDSGVLAPPGASPSLPLPSPRTPQPTPAHPHVYPREAAADDDDNGGFVLEPLPAASKTTRRRNSKPESRIAEAEATSANVTLPPPLAAHSGFVAAWREWCKWRAELAGRSPDKPWNPRAAAAIITECVAKGPAWAAVELRFASARQWQAPYWEPRRKPVERPTAKEFYPGVDHYKRPSPPPPDQRISAEDFEKFRKALQPKPSDDKQ